MAHSTRQKSAIREVLQAAGRPLTPAEVHAGAQKQLPRLGIATVYRAIKEMCDADELTRVAIPDQAVRYEPAHACGCDQRCSHPKPPPKGHAHFVCRQCHGVFCLPPAPLPGAPKGFRVESAVTLLHGLCQACAKS